MSDGRQNPRPRATALSYQRGGSAPRVVASGVGATAERIIETARQAGVPLREDPALAEALAALELGDDVPQPLYAAVAETLAWAYRVDRQAASG
jgi:flagellar biosynthesis protein